MSITHVPHGVRKKLEYHLEQFYLAMERGDHAKALENANAHRYLVEQELKRIAPPKPKTKPKTKKYQPLPYITDSTDEGTSE